MTMSSRVMSLLFSIYQIAESKVRVKIIWLLYEKSKTFSEDLGEYTWLVKNVSQNCRTGFSSRRL